MTFEFQVQPSFNFVKSFGEKFDIPVFDNSLIIPEKLGKGHIKMIDVEPGFKFVLHHYTLNQDFHLKRRASSEDNDLISIVFNSNEIPLYNTEEREGALAYLKNNGSSIQISSTAFSTETYFAPNSEVYFGVIGIKRPLLASVLRMENATGPMSTILDGGTLFFYHEPMNVEVKRILKQLSEINDQNKLSHLYYSIKTHELIYFLFNRLLHRDAGQQSPLNKADVEALYAIRAAIHADLGLPPQLKALAKLAGVGETKMKRLFKQTFGDTIYNYYQNERMQQAAFLLKQAGYSVSEAGYQLGFSNLSHFSRLFEKYFGITPKKYTTVG